MLVTAAAIKMTLINDTVPFSHTTLGCWPCSITAALHRDIRLHVHLSCVQYIDMYLQLCKADDMVKSEVYSGPHKGRRAVTTHSAQLGQGKKNHFSIQCVGSFLSQGMIEKTHTHTQTQTNTYPQSKQLQQNPMEDRDLMVNLKIKTWIQLECFINLSTRLFPWVNNGDLSTGVFIFWMLLLFEFHF